MEFPRFKTPISAKDAAAQLSAALAKHGVVANRNGQSLLLAQIWWETDSGRALDNHNPGNITGESQFGYFRPAWYEPKPDASQRTLDLHKKMLEGHAPNKFRAYPTFEAGFDDHASHLAGTYAKLVELANVNDAQGMADEIKRHYTPDAPATLGASLRALQGQLLASGVFGHVEDVGPPAPIAFAGVGPLILLLLLFSRRKYA
jgi:hypothetical protein